MKVLKRIIDRAESGSLSRVDRLAAACHAIRLIVQAGSTLSKEQQTERSKAVDSLSRCSDRLPVLTAYPATYKTGGAFGQTAQSPSDDYSAKSYQIPTGIREQAIQSQLDAIDSLQTIAGQAQEIQEQADRLRVLIDTLTADRPQNSQEADFISALAVCHASDMWERNKNTNQNHFGFNGSIQGNNWRTRFGKLFVRGYARRGKLTSQHGRSVSAVRGFRVWDEILSRPDSKPASDSLHFRNGAESIRRNRIWTIVRELQTGAIASSNSLTHTVKELDALSNSTAFSDSVERTLERNYSGDFYVRQCLSSLFSFRNSLERLKLSGMFPERCRAVNRAAERQHLLNNGVNCQVRLSQFEFKTSVGIVVDWRVYSSQSFTIQTVPIVLPLVACLALTSQGLETEYSVGRITGQELQRQNLPANVSAAVIRCLRSCNTLHSSGLVEIKPEDIPEAFDRTEIGKAAWKLSEQIERHFRYHLQHSIDRTPQTNKDPDRRKSIARMAKSLRSVETVTLSDSYKAGNCKAGTADFCRRWNITGSSISGRKLCQLWKDHNWAAESLFVAVLERVTGETL
ncbi:MAG: hypothetical protein ACO22U_17110 [bacterium]